MPKVFLSPSNQYDNRYAYGDTTEGVQCGKIAEACKEALERSGVAVKLMHDESMQEKCAASNAFDADLHVPIHTNAFNGTVSGTRMFYYAEGGEGQKACQAIFNRLAPVTPAPARISGQMPPSTRYGCLPPLRPISSASSTITPLRQSGSWKKPGLSGRPSPGASVTTSV